MNSAIGHKNQLLRGSGGGSAAKNILRWATRATFAVAIWLWPSLSSAGGVVTNTTEANLRAAMVGGGMVTFACDGTITLSGTITNTLDTVLDATGHQITISGGDAVRVFCIRSNVTFAVNHLTIADGRSTDNGAGILNQNGTVNATATTFYSNRVLGATGPSSAGGSVGGGAVASSGAINLVNCAFTFNSAVGGAGSAGVGTSAAGFGGGSGVGGAIRNVGTLTGSGCSFAANAATGGSGGNGGPAGMYFSQPGGPGGPGGDGSGAAVFNSGVVRLVNCTWSSNTGFGGYGGYGGPGYPPYSPPGPNGSPGLGMGAIYNAGGQCYLTNCAAVSNSCVGAILARGGAVRNESGEVYLSGCVLVSNSTSGAIFGNGPGASCWGGAVDNSGTLTADLCNFYGNSAAGATGLYAGGTGYGASGGSGGDGKGGALYNSGTISILRSVFDTNRAIGGTGGPGRDGYFGDPGSPGFDGGPGGNGGSGGSGIGGAIYNAGTARVLAATFAFNSGSGGNAGAGGIGGGSAYRHGGNGGGGGAGGSGAGSFFNSGDAQLINCTFAFNTDSGGSGGNAGGGGIGVFGGNGGAGGNGGSGFGAIFDQGFCCLTNCSIAASSGFSGSGGPGGTAGHGSYQDGIPGVSGLPGSSGGGIKTTTSQMVNTLLAANSPGNCSGVITDLGHNLSSDSSCAFSGPGSLNNTDPKLGSLSNNGGPTLTMALLPGSPAIDAGDSTAAPQTDQRGYPRPAGLSADIGALEYGSMLPVLSITRPGANQLKILVQGNSNQWCRLIASSDFSDWNPIATNQIGGDGKFLYSENLAPGVRRFYRVAMP